MKILLIGTDPATSEMALLSLRLRWPEAQALVATWAAEGVDLVERELPDVVLLQPNMLDKSLFETIEDIRRFSEVPLIALGREDEEAELWGDRVDSAPLVKKYVQRLRKKLSDDAKNPHWIASVHGTGYRFVGPGETHLQEEEEERTPSKVLAG